MKTKQELNEDINGITMVISENYPELSKYINEMPITIPIKQDSQITLKDLSEYYNSLYALVNQYAMKYGHD